MPKHVSRPAHSWLTDIFMDQYQGYRVWACNKLLLLRVELNLYIIWCMPIQSFGGESSVSSLGCRPCQLVVCDIYDSAYIGYPLFHADKIQRYINFKGSTVLQQLLVYLKRQGYLLEGKYQTIDCIGFLNLSVDLGH